MEKHKKEVREMSENSIGYMVSTNNKKEADELTQIIKNLSVEKQKELKIFLEGVKFWETQGDNPEGKQSA